MNNLRALILINCDIVPFARALDPKKTASNLVLCSDMGELVLHGRSLDRFHLEPLIDMAMNRASGGAKLLSFKFADLGGQGSKEELLKLREHVSRVECWVEQLPPAWDDIPSESDGESEKVWETVRR